MDTAPEQTGQLCQPQTPVSHYTGKYASESETERKTQKLSFQGNFAHEQTTLSQSRLLVSTQMILNRKMLSMALETHMNLQARCYPT